MDKNGLKTGGRQKGKKNRLTEVVVPLVQQMKLAKFDLVLEVVRLYPLLEHSDQADMLLRLMEFVFPKKKTITVEEAKGVLNDYLVQRGIVLDSVTEDDIEAAAKDASDSHTQF